MSRRTARLRGVVVAVVVAALLGAGLVHASSSREADAAGTARTQATGGYLLDWGDAAATRTLGMSYVVLQAWEHRTAAAIKKANPRARVFMYKNASAARKDTHESGMASTGVTYAEAETNGWLLRDGTGRVLEWSSWRGLHPVDVADRRYQDRWLENTRRDLRRGPWDGVLIDDVLSRLSQPTLEQRVSTTIRTDAQMRTATTSFLSRVGPGLRRGGWVAYPNVTDVRYDTWRPVMWQWRPHIDGFLHEFFVKWGHQTSPRFTTGDDWLWKFQMARWAARTRLPMLAVTYSDRSDRRAQAYHRASWLLAWNGRDGASVFSPHGQHLDHTTPLSTTSIDRPSAKPRKLVSGVWRRTYRGGVVLVNPTATKKVVRLVRAHRRPNGKLVRRVVLSPSTGVVLARR